MGVTKTALPGYLCLSKVTPKFSYYHQQSFYHITCFKCDKCQICSEFLKTVEWIRYNVQIKSIIKTYVIRAFLDIMSIITPDISIHHSVKAILYMVTILCSTGSTNARLMYQITRLRCFSHGYIWSRHHLLVFVLIVCMSDITPVIYYGRYHGQ